MPRASGAIKLFMLMAKSILKFLLSPAEKDLLYLGNLLISRQIYTRNLKDLAKRNLLYITNLLISKQIYAQNLTRFGGEKFFITSLY